MSLRASILPNGLFYNRGTADLSCHYCSRFEELKVKLCGLDVAESNSVLPQLEKVGTFMIQIIITII